MKRFIRFLNVAFCKVCGAFFNEDEGTICSRCLNEDDFPYGG